LVRQRILEWRKAEPPIPNGDSDVERRLEKAIKALGGVMKPRHTSEVFHLISLAEGKDRKTLGYDPTYNLFSILLAHPYYVSRPELGGDRDRMVPLCLEELRKLLNSPVDAWSPQGGSLRYVRASSHPLAVRFMREILRNRSLDTTWRQLAYTSLAGTGDRTALREVLALRDRRRTLPPLREMIGLDQIDETGRRLVPPEGKMRAVGRDPQGVLWGWFGFPFSGAYTDRWLVQREGDRWGNPMLAANVRPEEEIIPDWLERFPSQASELARDTDCDGWTNRLEERLGTDPYRADTDGDGLRDSSDRNPLAAPRPLSEREQILAAAFEACFHFDRVVVPCVVELPEGMKPFELTGWKGVTVTVADRKQSPLRAVWPEGACFARFSPQSEGYGDITAAWGKHDGLFHWNPARTEVKLQIGIGWNPRGGEGYNLHLRQIGTEWVVINWRIAWQA
jgi:hypothetical protein